MAKLWRCALQVRSPGGQCKGVTYGYGATPDKAHKDAIDVQTYRRETLEPDTKPRLDQVDESIVTGVPMVRR